ncbi:hypothetical protein GDO78_016929 [Eleutherodactylus coqui]|uniref:Uncharacterized protein n=1 Tax=Eleutherodactylus coqui TaxID=57060 RepID=A0A8J6B4U4_ELECQ|nr:hypothetical protein GDO78_016929 [Eleutherodactylus coqui]
MRDTQRGGGRRGLSGLPIPAYLCTALLLPPLLLLLLEDTAPTTKTTSTIPSGGHCAQHYNYYYHHHHHSWRTLYPALLPPALLLLLEATAPSTWRKPPAPDLHCPLSPFMFCPPATLARSCCTDLVQTC